MKATHDFSLFIGGKSLYFFAFSDANYEKSGNGINRLGNCIFPGLDSGAIYNESISDPVIAHSSTESELRALDRLIRVLMYLKSMLEWIGIVINDSIPIYIDNKSMEYITITMKQSKATNHINTTINYIRERYNLGHIHLVKVASGFNVADIHTKNVPVQTHRNHRGKISRGFGNKLSNIHQLMEEYN